MFYHYKIIPLISWQQYMLDVMVFCVVILSMVAWGASRDMMVFQPQKPSWLPQFPIVVAQDQTTLQSQTDTGHMLIVSASQIKNSIRTHTDIDQLHQQVRRSVLRQLIGQGYNKRSSYPYRSDTNGLMTLGLDHQNYELHRDIRNADALDLYIRQQLSSYTSTGKLLNKALIVTKPIIIPQELRSSWSDLYLFKNKGDLEFLGYEVVSSRTRVNKDKEYRRYNIQQAFAHLGNMRVINPGQEIKYLDGINFDGREKQNYKYGLSIIGDEEIMDYGGGVCGSSTAIYQGILTNTALTVTKWRAHTRRYSDLYPAVINGQLITTPGIDSALYGPALDLYFRNDRSYPVILVANYDGTIGGVEEVFTLSRPSDQGSFEFVSSYKTSTVDTITNETLRGGCYTWNINGENRRSCYKKVQ